MNQLFAKLHCTVFFNSSATRRRFEAFQAKLNFACCKVDFNVKRCTSEFNNSRSTAHFLTAFSHTFILCRWHALSWSVDYALRCSKYYTAPCIRGRMKYFFAVSLPLFIDLNNIGKDGPDTFEDFASLIYHFCGFRGQQRKQMSGFLTKLE